MMRVTIILLVAVAGSGLWACQGDRSSTTAELPVMTRETPPPKATRVELPVPKAGTGSFENLVADYESKDRVIWQKPGMVISLLGNLEGKTIADIGAGTGYFTFRMVPLAKKVVGIDIDSRFISFMDSVKVRLPEQYRNRFESRLAKPNNPMLEPGEADAVIIVNTYGYIENRVQYLKTLSKGIAAAGQLLIIDFKKNNLPVGPPDEFKVALSQVEKELRSSGFEVVKLDNETLDYQYIVLAQKK